MHQVPGVEEVQRQADVVQREDPVLVLSLVGQPRWPSQPCLQQGTAVCVTLECWEGMEGERDSRGGDGQMPPTTEKQRGASACAEPQTRNTVPGGPSMQWGQPAAFVSTEHCGCRSMLQDPRKPQPLKQLQPACSSKSRSKHII